MLWSGSTYFCEHPLSLGGISPGWSISYRDIAEEKLRYFFPVGDRWPDAPSNYMGFRYDGKLQSIHHVKSYDTFTRPSELFPKPQPISNGNFITVWNSDLHFDRRTN